jgi:hypothetical protein
MATRKRFPAKVFSKSYKVVNMKNKNCHGRRQKMRLWRFSLDFFLKMGYCNKTLLKRILQIFQ